MLAERAGEAVVADDAAPAQRSGGAAGGGGWIGRVGKKLVMAVAGAFLASKARYIGDQLSGRSPRRRSANATRTAAGTAGSTLGYEIGKARSEEHTSELQSLMRTSYAVFCLKKKTKTS